MSVIAAATVMEWMTLPQSAKGRLAIKRVDIYHPHLCPQQRAASFGSPSINSGFLLDRWFWTVSSPVVIKSDININL
jgi:hypothetical protein